MGGGSKIKILNPLDLCQPNFVHLVCGTLEND